MSEVQEGSQQAQEDLEMVGRKDKSGKRNELTIGLFECCGKTFRSALNKRKI